MEIAPPGESGVRAILAGADILTCVRMTTTGSCQPEMIDDLHAGLVKAVQDGRISMERLDESVRRILALKEKYRVGPATGEGLDAIQGAAHQRAVADLLEAAADRREEEGRP
jgi:beta-glucosidase-like glycosyl hydrolase